MRNWMAIATIADYWTRVAISLATDPDTLKRFRVGWPECFKDGEDTGPLWIPLSVLRAAVLDHYLHPTVPDEDMIETIEFARCFWLSLGWVKRRELDLPIVAFGPDQGRDIPRGMAGQFVGQTPNDLIKLTWDGQEYIVVWAEFAPPPGERFDGSSRPNDRVKLDEPFQTPPHLSAFGMVLAAFVGRDA